MLLLAGLSQEEAMQQVRAGLYARVSDDQDERSRSVPQQRDALSALCGREGWRVAASYEEPDRSASRFSRKARPEWARLLADVSQGRIDVVVLWESSRGDRKLTGWSQFLDECRDRGVRIHVESHHHTYDLSVPRDWKTLAEEGIDSAYESEKTSMRIKRDLADAAANGRPHGRKAYGYLRVYDVKSGRLDKQVPSEHAPVVREIITRIAGGDAVTAIWRDLNLRGIPGPSGGKWARSTITRLVLEGVCYIGKRRHNGGPLLDGDWPAIVDEEVYWKAVAVLSDPARKKAADRRGGIRPGAAKWLLSYIAACAKCGSPLGVRMRELKAGDVPYYRCPSGGGCAMMPVAFMDHAVSEAVIRWAARPGIYEEVMRRDDSEAGAALAEADSERARLAEFEAQAISGAISAAAFARIASGIETRIAELEARARRDSTALGVLLENGREMANVRACWEGMPLTARRRVVSTLTASPGYLRLAPGGRLHGDPDVSRIELRFADDKR
jgi:site-specific DNA recombinase